LAAPLVSIAAAVEKLEPPLNSLSAAYEIIELWDEVYFHGQRIWGKYDTATDLQWDLFGIIAGTVFSCIILRIANFELGISQSALRNSQSLRTP